MFIQTDGKSKPPESQISGMFIQMGGGGLPKMLVQVRHLGFQEFRTETQLAGGRGVGDPPPPICHANRYVICCTIKIQPRKPEKNAGGSPVSN